MIVESCESPRATDPLRADASGASGLPGGAATRVNGGHGSLRFTRRWLVRPGVTSERCLRAGGEAVRSIETGRESPPFSIRGADAKPEPLGTPTPEVAALSREFP